MHAPAAHTNPPHDIDVAIGAQAPLAHVCCTTASPAIVHVAGHAAAPQQKPPVQKPVEHSFGALHVPVAFLATHALVVVLQ